jgi:hypothetical protein
MYWSLIILGIASHYNAQTIQEYPIPYPKSAYWCANGSLLVDQGELLTTVNVDGSKDSIKKSDARKLVGTQQDSPVYYDRKTQRLLTEHNGDLRELLKLPKKTVRVTQYDETIGLIGYVLRYESEKLSYEEAEFRQRGKLVLRLGKRSLIWDAKYQPETGLAFTASSGFGIAGNSHGISVFQVNNRRTETLWDPVDLSVPNTKCFSGVYPPSQSVFIGKARVLRSIIVPGSNFDSVFKDERSRDTYQIWGRVIGPEALKETKLELHISSMDMEPYNRIATIVGEFPPIHADYNESTKRLAVTFPTKVVVVNLRAAGIGVENWADDCRVVQ